MKNLAKVMLLLFLVLSLSGCNLVFGTASIPTGTPYETPPITNRPDVTISPTITGEPTVTNGSTVTTEPTVSDGTTVTEGLTTSPTATAVPTPTPTSPPTKQPTPTPTKRPTATPTPAPTPHPTPVCTPGENFNDLVNPSGDTIETRFLVPDGFERVSVKEGSFAEYLRLLSLKADGSKLHYLDSKGNPAGTVPDNIYHAPQAHAAILDFQMYNKNEQCADTIMHLYAEYLYAQERYDEIVFSFSNGFKCDFRHYMNGYWPNSKFTSWTKPSDAWTSENRPLRDIFDFYMKTVFSYANTWSMHQYDLQKVNISDIAIGDMFIVPGYPGHVVLVVDMIKNTETGEVRFMTAQGSMPAVEAHVMLNAEEGELSPWQNTRFEGGVFTSATYWTCPIENLRRFK